MKSSKQFLILLYALFLISFSYSCYAFNDEKINLEIELLNADSLLSNKHLKKEKHIEFRGENVSIKYFEKIHKNVLEKAFIIAETDELAKVDSSTDKNLLKLKNLKNSSEEPNSENTDSNNQNDEEENLVKVVSTEESTENDIHMIRKVYQKTVNNKETTYCYMIYTFNFDLEKMSENNLNDIFQSLDKMPDYLAFLNKNDRVSDTEKILENENGIMINGQDKGKVSAIAAVELHNSESDDNLANYSQIDIPKFVLNLDSLINYFVLTVGSDENCHEVIKKLNSEREYLYNLESELTPESVNINNNLWENKLKFEKFYMHIGLNNIKEVFNMYINGDITDNSNKENAPILFHLVEKVLFCGDLLSQVDIMDYIILNQIKEQNLAYLNENVEKDANMIKKCIAFNKLVLHKKKFIEANKVKHFHSLVHTLKNEKEVEGDNDLNAWDILSEIVDRETSKNDSENISTPAFDNSNGDVEENIDMDYKNDNEDENTQLDNQIINLKKEIDSDEAFLSGENADIVAPIDLLNDSLKTNCDSFENNSTKVNSLLELNEQLETTENNIFEQYYNEDDEDDEDDDENDDDDDDDDVSDDDEDDVSDDDEDVDSDDDENDNDEDEGQNVEFFGFKNMLKDEAKKGIKILGNHAKKFAINSGKKLLNKSVRAGSKFLSGKFGKLIGGAKFNSKSNESRKKITKISKSKKINKRGNKKSLMNKSSMKNKTKGLKPSVRKNIPKSFSLSAGKKRATGAIKKAAIRPKSSLRNSRGKGSRRLALISLSTEMNKRVKNESAIKKEIKKIQKTYKKLKEKKENLKEMLHKPALSDQKIIEEFENYMKADETEE